MTLQLCHPSARSFLALFVAFVALTFGVLPTSLLSQAPTDQSSTDPSSVQDRIAALQQKLETDQATADRLDQQIQQIQSTPCYGNGVAAMICNTTKGASLGRLQIQDNQAHAQVTQDQQDLSNLQS